MGKRAPEKNRCLTVNLHHDGVFTVSPFEYSLGDEKQITDIHFEDSDVDEFVNFGYRNKWQVNLYVKHSGYDALDIRDQEKTMADDGNESSDEEDLSYVDFHTEVDDNVVIKNVTTNDPFLNKLCPDSAQFLNVVDKHVFANDETVVEDSQNIHPKFNVKSRVTYIRHDPNQNWKKIEPVLGMRFDNPEQLKMCLANYGVANGYQLWFYRNDWMKLLVYCGRDMEAGRCVGYNSMKKKKKTELGENESLNVMKKKKKTELGENESLNVNKVTTRSRSKIDEGTSKSPKTPIRAITSGSLMTYRWITHHYAKQLIADPFIPTLKMKTDIREKFLINVILRQCKRAKQRALFDYEGGLKEHYGRLWGYRQTILDSNPGSTCRLDDEETESGHYYFKRIYVCFKGVKEGWLAGCRKVIGLDGCFLKHTCRGELLVAMVRDANNQMYLIAWAVVKVENNKNWCWFISLIHEDLHLETGEGLIIISDSYKTQESVAANMITPSAESIALATHSTDKGKQVAEPKGNKKGSKRKAPTSSEEAAGNKMIIFHKNRGRSERIFNQKMKKSGFGPNGEGSTPDKAFSLT
ncbi:calcium/proton exchanger [Tanacetum coccineum]